MNRRLLLPSAALVLVIILAALAAWIAAPRLAAVSPAPGNLDVSPDAVVQLAFSQPMDFESLKAHLQIEPETSGLLTWEEQTLTFLPDQPWTGGQTITVTLHSGARASGGLGLPVWGSTTWSFKVGEILLAYLWPANDLADLYALNPTNGEIIRLTESAVVHDYAVSPDGRHIFYVSDRLRGGSNITRLSFDPSGMTAGVSSEVVGSCENAVCRNPAASPNGRWLAYEQVPDFGGRDQIGVWLLDLTSGESQPASNLEHPGRYPTWSKTGWLAFYDPTDQAYLAIHPESGSTERLPNLTGEPGSWRSDGSGFIASEIFDESSDLLVTAASGHMLLYDLNETGKITDLTREYYLEDTGGVFAPNGRQIAFTRKYLDQARWTAGRQLWVMDISADGSEITGARQLTDTPVYNHYSIAWSPNSQQIAFMRFNQAEIIQLPELWLVNADGSNPIQLVIGGYAPQWIP